MKRSTLLAGAVFSPLLILATVLRGWPGLILVAMFGALLWAASDDR